MELKMLEKYNKHMTKTINDLSDMNQMWLWTEVKTYHILSITSFSKTDKENVHLNAQLDIFVHTILKIHKKQTQLWYNSHLFGHSGKQHVFEIG